MKENGACCTLPKTNWSDIDIHALLGTYLCCPPISECSIIPAQQHSPGTALYLNCITWLPPCCAPQLQWYLCCQNGIKLACSIHLSFKCTISSLDCQMLSQQSVVQQVSDMWVAHMALLNKLTIQTVWLSTMLWLLPLMSLGRFVWGLVVISLFQTALLVYNMLLTLSLKVKYILQKKQSCEEQVRLLQPNYVHHWTDTICSLSVIILCCIHLNLLEKYAQPNGSTHSSPPPPVRTFNAATCWIYKAVMDEFGDQSITETLDIFSLEYIEFKDCHALNTEWIDLDEFPWVQRSLGELENTAPAVEPHN